MTDTMTEDRQIALSDIPLARDLVPTDRKLLPAPMAVLEEGADLIEKAGGFVSQAVRSDRGACVALSYMAALHGTDLIATASKAYLVPGRGGEPGRLAFEAQYINAIVQRHLTGRPDYTYEGSGATRQCRVVATPRGDTSKPYTTPQLGQIKVRNSPLWVTDPDQQLSYYAIRAWARRHMPDVLLGIYAVDELQSITIRDVTPPPADPFRDDEGELEEVTPEEDDVPEKPFEPSGGFTTDADSFPGVENLRDGAVADDILAWAEACKADARAAETVPDLHQLWDGCEMNRRKLWRSERLVHDELEQAFKDRQAELERAAG